MSKISWQVASVTDAGLKRQENQDNFYISPDERLLVVADGMGGMRGGSKASQLAVSAVEELWQRDKPHDKDAKQIQTWLLEAVASANERVFKAAASDPKVKDMGTTIVAAVHCANGTLQIAHVGESRAYLVREGKTVVLTQDHSVVMEMLVQGKMSEDQLQNSPFRHYLTRCVGHKSQVEIDHTPAELKPGDWLILSSDGLSTVLQDAAISESAKGTEEASELCKKLLQATLDGGAPDNVTIIAVRYTAPKAEDSEDSGVHRMSEQPSSKPLS